MRGTSVFRVVPSLSDGIIPAYAGNMLSKYRLLVPIWDHPRVCGEHNVRCRHISPFLGSSPRMRGTCKAGEGEHEHDGIIPAYAGNIRHRSRHKAAPRDHPRVCGEHADLGTVAGYALGSSPRMRGTLSHFPAVVSGRGDHPRVCGEHASLAQIVPWPKGSSPRMRGTS